MDLAGNEGVGGTRIVRLDAVYPLVNYTGGVEVDGFVTDRDWIYINTTVTENNFANITFNLYDNSGASVSSVVFSDSTREYNFTNLGDGIYYYNVSVLDFSGNENWTETREIGLDGVAPVVEIVNPKAKTYGYNESLPLESSVYDSVSGVDSCWWNIDGGANKSIACNSATTFNTTVASHIINFYANDSFGNIGSDSVTFFISVTGPAIELVAPSNNTFYGQSVNVSFSFSANDPDGVDSCSLWGDWGAGWSKDSDYNGTWGDIGFKKRRTISFMNNEGVDIVNYPAYINLTSNYSSLGDFSDIRFFNGSCNEEQNVSLSHEVEFYDSVSGDLWVKIPLLSSSGADICMYYDNDNSNGFEDAVNVWNNYFALVYHMDNQGQDSTSNNRDRVSDVGVPENNDLFLGEGLRFGIGNAWSQGDLSWWESSFSERSHEIIFETGNDINSRQVLFAEGGGANGVMMYILNGQLYARWWSESLGFSGDYINVSISANTKYYAVMSYANPGNYTLYLNANIAGTKSSSTNIDSHGTNGGIGYTGSNGKDFHDLSNSAGHYFLGSIYEFRGYDVYLNESWVNMTYNSIFNEGSFINYGQEEDFSAFNVSVSSEGGYNWNVKCNDTQNYSSFALTNYTFIVDVTDPVVLFSSGTETNNSIVGRDWIYMDANVVENNFANITFNLYKDGSLINSASFSDSTRAYNFTGLQSGVYEYNISVFDLANREGFSETRIIKLDLSGPSAVLISPENGSYRNLFSQNLTGNFSDSTGLLNATLYVFNKTGSLIYTAFKELNGVNLAVVGLVYDFLADGIYYWFYRVEDIVGNIQDTENNTLIIDTKNPLIDYAGGVEANGSIFERENIYVNVTVNESYFSNLTFYLYDSDGLVFSNVFSDSTRDINWTLLPDESYKYNVSVMDLAGNENWTETRELTLDNIYPSISYGALSSLDGAYVSGDTVSVYVTVVEANEDNITFRLYDENNSEIRKNTFYDGRRSISWNLLSEGLYYYNVSVVDRVGHISSTLTRSINIDNTNPQVSFGFGTDANNTAFRRNWVYAKANLIEDNFANITFNLYNDTGLVDSVSFSDTTREYNFTNLVDGVYYYNVSSYDLAGNIGSTETRQILLDNVSPLINYAGGVEIDGFNKTDDWVYVSVSVVEDNFANITFNLYNDAGLVDSVSFLDSTREYNFTNLPSNVYYYNVSVFDLAGGENFTETRKIGLDYVGPGINLINPKAKAYGYNISLPLDYIVSDNIVGVDSCWYNIDGGVNVSLNCSGSDSFNTSDGEHTLHFYANDSFGNGNYKNVTFLVSTTGPAIQLLDPADNTFYSKATEVFFNYTAEDPDLTESCSLWGSWNGGWHKNATDFDWIRGDTGNLSEDFEMYNDFDLTLQYSNFSNVAGDDCDWQTDSGGTASSGTGPANDHTLGNATGEFLYIETSTAGSHTGISEYCENSGDEAYLESDSLDADSNNYNLSFWYHMYGSDTGTLSVDVYSDGAWANVWSVSGQQQASDTAAYLEKIIDLSDYSGTIKVRVRASNGGGYQSDIAIDDLLLSYVPGSNKPYGNFSVNISEEGSFDWNVECNDTKGYNTWAVSNYSVVFDVTDPVVDYVEGVLVNDTIVGDDWIYVNTTVVENNFANITFNLYNETGLYIRRFFNDSTREYNFTNLVDGVYYYNVSVWDLANRFNSTETRKVTIDITSPSGSLNSPVDNSYSKNSTINFTASFSDLNGLSRAILYIFNQTGLVYSEIVLLGGALSSTIGVLYTFLTDGVYDWFYAVEDVVNNSYNITSNRVVVDSTLPVISFIAETLDNDSYVDQSYVYMNTSVIEDNFANITFYLYDDNGIVSPSPITYSSSVRDINFTNLVDGVYYYNVSVWDLAGNFNWSERRRVTLDGVFPVVNYAGGVFADGDNVSSDWIYINTTVIEDNFANITFNLYDSGYNLISNVSFSDSTREYNFTNLVDGVYYYNVSVWDLAGHNNVLSTRSVKLDDTAPLVDYSSGTAVSGSVFERDWIYIDSNVYDLNFKNMSYRLYDNNSILINETWFDYIEPSINFSTSGENKTYYYDIWVWDYANNYAKTQKRNITLIDTTAPSLILNSPENITYPYTDGIRLDFVADDVHLDSCWYSLDGGANVTLGGCSGISMNFADETTHSLNLYVNDTMGYMNSSSVVFSVNSSLIETPTYKVIRGSSFVDGNVTETISITDMSKSFILHTSRSSDNGPDTLRVVSRFDRSDEVSFFNYDTGAGAIVDWSVISGPGISAQRGEISFSGESNLSLNINEVNLSSSFLIVNTKLNSGDSNDNVDAYFRGYFVDNGSVEFRRGENSAGGVVGWQVVDWRGVLVKSGEVNLTDGEISSFGSFSGVDLNKSLIVFSSEISGASSVGASMIRADFVNSTTVNFSRFESVGNVSISYFVLESDLFRAQRGNYNHLLNSNVQPINMNYNLINPARAFDVHSNENEGITSTFASGFVTQLIYNESVINLQKGVSNWQAIEILDLDSPNISLSSPVDNYNYSGHSVGPFSFSISDDSNMSNCSLLGSWGGGWHVNQTIYNVDSGIENSFSSVDVGGSGYYNWSVECYDIYGNFGISKNRTFSAFLPPNEPILISINQTSNDGLGNISFSWKATNDTSKYNIYYSDNLTNFVLLASVGMTNYTDSTFAGNKRRFYKVEAWNPSASNMSSKIFGAHVYELYYNNVSVAGSVTNRNWIGFPTNFSYLKNANDTLNEISGAVAISMLNKTTQKQVTCSDFSCPESFSCTDTACNFDLVKGEGYEVLVNESGNSSINWSGVGIVNDAVSINLVYDETGTRYNKNWVSIYAGTTLKDANDFVSSVLGDDAITRWNAKTQSSEGLLGEACFPWGLCIPIGKNFNVNMEEGYEISVTQDSIWVQQ